MYLDPVGRDSGCLRCIPGSHLSPLHEQLWSLHTDLRAHLHRTEDKYPGIEDTRRGLWERWRAEGGEGDRLGLPEPRGNLLGLAPDEVPAEALESSPGDVCFFSQQTWHASFHRPGSCRMFAMAYSCPTAREGGAPELYWEDMPLGGGSRASKL